MINGFFPLRRGGVPKRSPPRLSALGACEFAVCSFPRRAGRWSMMLAALLVLASGCVCAARVRTMSPDPQAASETGPADVAGVDATGVDADVQPVASGAAAAATGVAVGPIVTQPQAGRDIRIGDPIIGYILAGGLVLAVLAYPVGRLIWRTGDGRWRLGRKPRGLLRPPVVRRGPPKNAPGSSETHAN